MLSEIKEIAQSTRADLNAVKGTEFFLLNKKLQTMKEQLRKQQMLSSVLNERKQLNDNFIQRLTEKLVVARTGEGSMGEYEEEEVSDDGNCGGSELPPSLEKLAVELNTFMHCTHPATSRSFVEDKEETADTNEEYSSKCHSEYSDFEEENPSKSPIAEESDAQLQFETSAARACELCLNEFSWCTWRHRCRNCRKYFVDANIGLYATGAVQR